MLTVTEEDTQSQPRHHMFMHTCIFTHMHMHKNIHTHVHAHMHIHICANAHKHLNTYTNSHDKAGQRKMNTIRPDNSQRKLCSMRLLFGLESVIFSKCGSDHIDTWTWYHVFPQTLLVRVSLKFGMLHSWVQDCFVASFISFSALQNPIHSSPHSWSAISHESWLKPGKNSIFLLNLYSTMVQVLPNSNSLLYVLFLHIWSSPQTVPCSSFLCSGMFYCVLHTNMVCFKVRKLKIRKPVFWPQLCHLAVVEFKYY